MSLRIHQTVEDRDITELTVSGADGGGYWLAFWKEAAQEWWFTEEEIEVGCSANTLRGHI